MELDQLSCKILDISSKVQKKMTGIKNLVERLKSNRRHLEKLLEEEACLHAGYRKVSEEEMEGAFTQDTICVCHLSVNTRVCKSDNFCCTTVIFLPLTCIHFLCCILIGHMQVVHNKEAALNGTSMLLILFKAFFICPGNVIICTSQSLLHIKMY